MVVVGTESELMAAVIEQLSRSGRVDRVKVVGQGVTRTREGDRAGISRVESASDGDLAGAFENASSVILLGAPEVGRAILDGSRTRAVDGTDRIVDLDLARQVLAAASSAGVGHVTVLSGAMVYGAWSNNPVPLTEEATLRPEPCLAYAVALGELERLAVEWRDSNAAATVAVLRPTITVPSPGVPVTDRATRGRTSGTSEDSIVQDSDRSRGAGSGQAVASKWLNRSPWSPAPWRAGDVGQPSQYLLVTDLAAAIVLADGSHLDGPYNVAPEGWIAPERLPGLAGPFPQVRVPSLVADALLTARLRRRSYPPATAAYLHHPWVVASDRLRAEGWMPADRNEEAFVGSYATGVFSSMDAHRRQNIAFGVSGVAAAVLVTLVVVLVRRR